MLKINMMVKKKLELASAVILILVSLVFSGCWKSPEPEVAKTDNTNQSPAASNNNVPANNNISVNPPNTTAPSTVNNASTPANKDAKSSPRAKEPTPQIGTGGGDMVLFTQVRSALSSDQELLNAVIIEIKEGNATLTGNVSSAAQKTKAGQLAQAVKGVKSVQNNLRVKS